MKIVRVRTQLSTCLYFCCFITDVMDIVVWWREKYLPVFETKPPGEESKDKSPIYSFRVGKTSKFIAPICKFYDVIFFVEKLDTINYYDKTGVWNCFFFLLCRSIVFIARKGGSNFRKTIQSTRPCLSYYPNFPVLHLFLLHKKTFLLI